jgi:signal transduction histidine kinase/ActR/RegA family two-component response regulator
MTQPTSAAPERRVSSSDLSSANFLASEAFSSEQVRALFAGSPSVLFANFAVAFVFALVHWSAVAQPIMLGWIALIVVMLLTRIAFYLRFRALGHLRAPRFTPGQFDARRWLLGFRVSVLVSALCWGIGGYLFVTLDDPVRVAFCILAIGGLCAGSITALSVDQTCAMTFLFVTPLPTLYALLSHGSSSSMGLALFFIVGILFVGLTANKASESMFELIRLRFETDRAADALRTSEQRWKFALEGARQAVWDWDFSNKGTFFSSGKWREMIGFEGRDTFDSSIKTWREGVHPEDSERVFSALHVLMNGAQSRFEIDYRFQHRSGRYLWINSRGIVVARNDKGRPQRIIGANEDITQDRALREQLQQSQKMQTIGQLAGGVAHDFNNNLTAMMMSLDMLELDPALPPSALETVHELGQMTERAAKITAQLLLFARRQAVQMREIDVCEAMQKLSGMLARLIGEQVQLSLKLADGAILVQADAALLDQAVINLAVNARDAMPEGGTLCIRVDVTDVADGNPQKSDFSAPVQAPKVGRFARIRVTDSGTGMTEEVMRHLFEPFFTTKAVGKGTGLGLASVHGMAHQHHGWINAASTLGRGSEFSLYLPILEKTILEIAPILDAAPKPESTSDFGTSPSRTAAGMDQSGTAKQADAITQADIGAAAGSMSDKFELQVLPKQNKFELQVLPTQNKCVLVVEDEPMVRDSIARMLNHLGMRVLVAGNAAQALELWQAHAPEIEVLLTDLVMPGSQNGLALANQLRIEAPTLDIILMSGYSSDGTQGELRKAKELSRIQFLAKPFDLATLQSLLAAAR